MGRIVRNILSTIRAMLGTERLNDSFMRFFKMHFFFMVFTNLHGMFVNTLFFRVTGNSNIVMQYNVIVYAVTGPFMLLSIFLMKKRSPLACSKAGILLYIVMYLVFFFTMPWLQYSMPVIALLSGAAAGFYWISYATGLSHYATEDSRDVAMGLIALGGGIVTLAVPFFSGALISRFSGLLGYGLVFGIALVVALYTIWLTKKMAPYRLPEQATHFRQAWSVIMHSSIFRNLMASNFVRGIREGTFSFFLNILLFQIITDEFVVGVNTLLCSIASIAAASVYGRLVHHNNRVKVTLVSTCVLLAGAAMLLLQLSPITIIAFGMLNAFFTTYLLNPGFSLLFSALQAFPEVNEQLQGEVHSIKECWLNVGRVVGIAITFLMPSTNFGSVLSLILLTLTQLIMVAQLKSADTQLQKLQIKE